MKLRQMQSEEKKTGIPLQRNNITLLQVVLGQGTESQNFQSYR